MNPNADEDTRSTDGTENTEEPYRFVMPEWMEPFRDLINNTGNNPVEELLDDLHNNHRLLHSNIVRWSLAMGVYAQVQLLHALHEGGYLTPQS